MIIISFNKKKKKINAYIKGLGLVGFICETIKIIWKSTRLVNMS